MTPFMDKLINLQANVDIFRAVQLRLAECARDTPCLEDGSHNIWAASEEIVADLGTIILFNYYLTLTPHPMEREIDVVYRGRFSKSALAAVDSEARLVASYMSNKVMGRLEERAKAA